MTELDDILSLTPKTKEERRQQVDRVQALCDSLWPTVRETDGEDFEKEAAHFDSRAEYKHKNGLGERWWAWLDLEDNELYITGIDVGELKRSANLADWVDEMPLRIKDGILLPWIMDGSEKSWMNAVLLSAGQRAKWAARCKQKDTP